jgi:hypothetical protein
MNPLRSLFGLATKRPERRTALANRAPHFRPALEVLEARETPSGLAVGHPTDYSEFLSGSAKGQVADLSPIVFGHGHNATYYIADY